MAIRSTRSSRAARRARASAALALLLAFPMALAPVSARATAQPVRRFIAPFDCGSDELARRTGVLIGSASVPKVPTQTHGCRAVDPGPGALVWSWYTAPVDAHVDVRATAEGDPVCVFIDAGPCAATASARVTAGETYAIGASLASGGTLSAVTEIDLFAQ